MPKVPRNLVDDAMYGDPPEVLPTVLPTNKTEKDEPRDEFGRKLDAAVQKIEQIQVVPPRSRRDWVSVTSALKAALPGAKVNGKSIGYILVELDREGYITIIVQGSAAGFTVSTLEGLVVGEFLQDADELVLVVKSFITKLGSDLLRCLAG